MRTKTAERIQEKRDIFLPEIRDLGLARGFNNVEIIVSGGYPYVIDINGGRIAGQDMNIMESGINFAEIYLDLALGETVPPVEMPIGAISLKIKMDVIVRGVQLASMEVLG